MRVPPPRSMLMVAVVAGLLTAAATVRAEDAWHTMTASERSFTVELPAPPKYTRIELKTGAGAPYTMHQYMLDRGAIAYVVQTAVYPSEVTVTAPRVHLQGGLDSLAKNMQGGRWEKIDWVTHQGLQAVDAVGVRNNSAIRSFSVLKGRQVVTLMYAGPIGSAQSADVNRFLASLNLAPAP